MPERLNTVLGSSKELQFLLHKAASLEALQKHVNNAIPPSLATSVTVLGLDDGILALACSNATIAAKLRQLAPELSAKLQVYGCQVNGIRIKVQVTYTPPAAPKVARRLGNRAMAALSGLSSQLPDSPLKPALDRLSKRSG